MNKKLRTVLIIALFAVLIYSLARIVLMEAAYKKADAIYEKSRSESFHISYKADDTYEQSKPEEYFPEATVDFETLNKANADIVGWLWIPDTNINFPLLRAEDNRKYLNLSYDLQQTNSGSIFMDFRSSSDFTDDNTVIYGHNMQSGGMFGELKKFADSEYMNQNCNLYIFTEARVFKYQIFASYITENSSKSYTLNYSDDFYYNDFIEYIASSAGFGCDIVPAEATRLITLSTCTSVRRTERFVVHAYLVATKNYDDPAVPESSPADKKA